MMGPMVRGVILAAGASTRMGRPKAALSLSHRADTFVARLIRSFRTAGVPDIVVVSGAAPAEVRAAVGLVDRTVRLVDNAAWQTGQLSSLLVGLAAASPTGRAADVEAVLMTLVDVPLTSPATIAALVRVWRATGAPIVRPSAGARHGHPVLIDRQLFAELVDADPATGAKPVIHRHAKAIVNVEVEDEGAFFDVDTPAAYADLRSRLDMHGRLTRAAALSSVDARLS